MRLTLFLRLNQFFMVFQLGFLWNAIIRRVSMPTPPPDTIFPVILFGITAIGLISFLILEHYEKKSKA